MANNFIVYAGIDNYDIILYQAGILAKLGKKVLVLDNSDTHALSFSFPDPRGMDVSLTPIYYRNIHMGSMPFDSSCLSMYDDVLLAIGHSKDIDPVEECTRMVYVTDHKLHNTRQVKNLISMHQGKEKVSMLMRDLYGIKITPEYLSDMVADLIPPDKIDLIYHMEQDSENALLCQYNKSYGFTGISSDMKHYLLKMTGSFYPDINSRVIINAYRAARKGE